MDQVSRSQGGKSAAANNRRRGDGQFVSSPTPKVVDTTAAELNLATGSVTANQRRMFANPPVAGRFWFETQP